MSDQKPYMKISAGFYLKNKPKEQRGITQESWNFGNDPIPFSRLLISLIQRAAEFYMNTCNISIEDMNSELGILSEYVKGMKAEAK